MCGRFIPSTEGAHMADLVQVIAQAGPLPIKTAAKIESDAPTVVTLAGSVWTTTPNKAIGVSLSIDGARAAQAQLFANPADTHLSVVPLTFSYTFPFTQDQEHVFELDPLTGDTTSDYNDFYVVTVEY
jgi:hypothetical protein